MRINLDAPFYIASGLTSEGFLAHKIQRRPGYHGRYTYHHERYMHTGARVVIALRVSWSRPGQCSATSNQHHHAAQARPNRLLASSWMTTDISPHESDSLVVNRRHAVLWKPLLLY